MIQLGITADNQIALTLVCDETGKQVATQFMDRKHALYIRDMLNTVVLALDEKIRRERK